MYSFFRLSAAEGKKDFNLYELVPPAASAVFVTDDVQGFMAEVDDLTCSKNEQFLHTSKLFSCLRQYLAALVEDTPHGISREMNRMMISFHAPDNAYNQVLYCRLTEEDKPLIDRFANKYISSLYPPKTFRYKGEEITIYPMADGDFLSCYLTPDYMVLSYQKKLIEEVIDARKSGKSLAHDAAFARMAAPQKSASAATLYTHLGGMAGWTEFDMKLKDDYIYFSGVCHDADTCATFMDVLRSQESVKGFPGESLPSSAFYFTKLGVTDWTSLLSYNGMRQSAALPRAADTVMDRNRELSYYLMENGGHDVVACLFQREDTLQSAAAVLSFAVADVPEAERRLRSLVKAIPSEVRGDRASITLCYTGGHKAYPVYWLPDTTLFAQLTHFADSTQEVYAVFYDGRLLLAPDEDSLSYYIRQLEQGKVLTGAVAYQAGMDTLSDSYHFMLMADLDHVFRHPEKRLRFMPDFVDGNTDFFRNFILFVQLTCTDGTVYPNLVLKYKNE